MKRVTLFCGHYGSGKTNLAVNYALHLKQGGFPVALADIDVVNPYFRAADSRKDLEAQGIEVVALPFANSNVDLPALPPELYGLVQRRDICAVLDVGGDEQGVCALGRYVPYLREEDNYDLFFVVNFCRPLTRTPEDAFEVFAEIQAALPLRFSGIVNNTNLGSLTTPEDLLQSLPLAEKLCEMTHLPLAFTSFDRRLSGKIDIERPFAIQLQKKPV